MSKELLQAGEDVPHFDVRTIDGSRCRYDEIWQHRNLLLVCVPDPSRFADWLGQIAALDFGLLDTACVVTSDPVPGVPRPGLIVADRWGEIQEAVALVSSGGAPCPAALYQELEFVQHRCPECEGEAR